MHPQPDRMNINVPKMFSYGISFFTIIPINDDEYLMCVLHKEGDEPTSFYICQTDDERGVAMTELRTVKFSRSLLRMFVRSFREAKENDIIIKVGKEVFEITHDKEDGDHNIFQMDKLVKVTSSAEDLFCSVIESALDYMVKEDHSNQKKKLMKENAEREADTVL